MGKYDKLYEALMYASEQSKQKNFEVFQNELSRSMAEDIDKVTDVLDKDYIEKNKDYELRLAIIKLSGYRVFRNAQGKHIIKK